MAPSWPTIPLPLTASPIKAAKKPSIATRPLSSSTAAKAPLFQGRWLVRPSPNFSTGS